MEHKIWNGDIKIIELLISFSFFKHDTAALNIIRWKYQKSREKYPNTINVVARMPLLCDFLIRKIVVPLQRQSEQTV